MALGKLVFKLPAERSEFETAQNGGRYQSALSDIDNWLRALAKYEGKETVTIEDVRAKIREELDGLDF